ncbi:hypothetical protein DPV78_007390 [Talaromyces pinophilus]|nr:hypothetical protein DPV78_007390 [Talaromyces pinophilus]
MKTTSSLSTIFLCLPLLWATVSANHNILRYKQPLPPNVPIVETGPELRELQDANLGALVGPENGGWYLKYPDNGEIVAVSSDNLTMELDQRYMSLASTLENEGNHQGAADLLRELRENGADMETLKSDGDCGAHGCKTRGCSHPFCAYPGVPGKCPFYTGCYICSVYRRCY